MILGGLCVPIKNKAVSGHLPGVTEYNSEEIICFTAGIEIFYQSDN
jgi:hypothetical protein